MKDISENITQCNLCSYGRFSQARSHCRYIMLTMKAIKGKRWLRWIQTWYSSCQLISVPTIVVTSLSLIVIFSNICTYDTLTVLLEYFIITYMCTMCEWLAVVFLPLDNYTNTHYMQFYVLLDISQYLQIYDYYQTCHTFQFYCSFCIDDQLL